MKKFLKIMSIVLLAVVIATACMAFWQKENIESFITSTKLSKDEIAEKIDDSKKETDQLVESYTGGAIRDFSFEEEEQIRRGEITVEQAIAKVLGESYIKSSIPRLSGNSNADSSNKDIQSESDNENKDINSITSGHIAKMFMLKAEFLGSLGELERRAIADYKSLPNDSRNSSGKQAIITKYIGEASSLESSCDSKVNEVLSSLTRELKAKNGDLQIVKNLKKAYDEEKILKKSYYINTYK